MSTTERDRRNQAFDVPQQRMKLLPNYYRWIAHTFRDVSRGQVVELGSGAGLVLPFYLSRADKVVAVDHDPILLERLRETYPEAPIETVEMDLREDWNALPEGQADCVIALDVLEHFEDDALFAQRTARLLKPGGHAVVKVPAQSRLFSAMDEASGHYRRYDKIPLQKVYEDAGLRTKRVRPMNVLGSWAYRFKNKNKSTFSTSLKPGLLRWANRAIPFIRAIDILPLAGLSWVALFQKVDKADSS